MNEKKFHFIRRRELLIILAIAAAAALGIILPSFLGSGGKTAVIQYGDIVRRVNLSESGVFTLEDCGETVFEIADGKIRVREAVCPDKICEKTGYIGYAGQSIICVPEKIVITVESGSDESNTANVTVG